MEMQEAAKTTFYLFHAEKIIDARHCIQINNMNLDHLFVCDCEWRYRVYEGYSSLFSCY